MPVQIKRYSICTWGNPKRPNDDLWYGVRVFVSGKGGGWMQCCEGATPVLFTARENAEKYIRDMKKERGRDGFKKSAA